MRPLPALLRELAMDQSGVLRSSQLAEHGFTAREVNARIRSADWYRVTSRVVAIQRPTRSSMLWAASLHHHRIGLTGAAALELLGLPAAKDGRISLLGPRGTRQRPFDACIIITTERPEFLTASGPLRTPVPLSVAYAMGCAATVRQAVFHCTWAVQRRLVTLEEIGAAIAAAPNSPTMLSARRHLAVVDPGVHSTHEFDFANECRKRGLPTPARQVLRMDSEGRRRYTDVEFQGPNGTLVVEIDGLGHLDSQVWLDDQWRANEITLQGAPVLRIPALALRTDPERYFTQIRRAIACLN